MLKPATAGKPLREDSPVDADNLGSRPVRLGQGHGGVGCRSTSPSAGQLDLRTIRLGPLVDYDNYTPPGRLGREVARLFVGMGSRRSATEHLQRRHRRPGDSELRRAL